MAVPAEPEIAWPNAGRAGPLWADPDLSSRDLW